MGLFHLKDLTEEELRSWEAAMDEFRLTLPTGVLRPFVMPTPRSWSWALKGVERCLQQHSPGSASLALTTPAHLQKFWSWSAETGRILLLEEAVSVFRQEPERFLSACEALHKQKVHVVVGMTPKEWVELHDHDLTKGRVRRVDVSSPPPFTDLEARTIAGRARWGETLLADLSPNIARIPELLVRLLEKAELNLRASLATLPGELHGRIREYLPQWIAGYQEAAYTKGLTRDQRQTLRKVQHGDQILDSDDVELLIACGLVDQHTRDADAQPSGRYYISNPILVQHLPPPLVIHHLSDVHFGRYAAKTYEGDERTRATRDLGGTAGRMLVAESYLTFIQKRQSAQRGPHLILVSGDLTETASGDELKQARAWLDGLSATLGKNAHAALERDTPRVLLVGGNHDVSRAESAHKKPQARHAAFAAAMNGYPHPGLDEPPKDRARAIFQFGEDLLTVVLLGSAERGSERILGLHDPKTEAEEQRIWEEAEKAMRENNEVVYREAMAKFDHIDPGVVAHETLEGVEHFAWGALGTLVRIAVVHHPVSPVEGTLSLKPYPCLVNAAAVKGTLRDAGVQVVLHGHEHTAQCVVESPLSGQMDRKGQLVILSAPSLGSSQKDEKNGFVELTLVREGGEVTLQVQFYTHKGGRWAPEGSKELLSLTSPLSSEALSGQR